MNVQDRKLRQRIARRKERLQRLIAEQEARLASIRLATYLRRENYMRDFSRALNKPHQVDEDLEDALRSFRKTA